jgi:hypothetical protein
MRQVRLAARSLALTAVMTFCIGATFNPANRALIDNALALQERVVGAPAFAEILTAVERRGGITWDESIADCAKADAAAYPDKVAWIVARFRRDRGFASENVRAWRKWNPWSKTTASTLPCAASTRLNLWRLPRLVASVTGTLLHERTHSFGIVHANGQTTAANLCDVANITGVVAEAMLDPDAIGARQPICPALCDVLTERKVLRVCNRL